MSRLVVDARCRLRVIPGDGAKAGRFGNHPAFACRSSDGVCAQTSLCRRGDVMVCDSGSSHVTVSGVCHR